ncbi:hypothetical protein [Undibacterium sp. WLHG33]|uniref:hypothetical protein n=1 Tax=Undibacterium sp. WLHG33 TaxID=3412482 RepID=UPI003C2FACE3
MAAELLPNISQDKYTGDELKDFFTVLEGGLPSRNRTCDPELRSLRKTAFISVD